MKKIITITLFTIFFTSLKTNGQSIWEIKPSRVPDLAKNKTASYIKQINKDNFSNYTLHKSLAIVNHNNIDFNNISSTNSGLTFVTLITQPDETDMLANIGFKIEKNFSCDIKLQTPFEKGKISRPVGVDEIAKGTSGAINLQWDLWKFAKPTIDENDLVRALDAIGKLRKPDCCKDPERHPTYDDLDDDEKAIFERTVKYKLRLPFLGMRIKGARKDFDYFSDTSLLNNIISNTNYPFELKLYGGYRFSNHFSIALSAIYQQYYDAGDANIYNITVKPGTSIQRTDILLLTPEKKDKINIQAECRWMAVGNSIGLNPILMIDAKNKIADVRVQFYFLNLKEEDVFKGLNGGVFIGYRTDKEFGFSASKNNFLAGIFFTSVFDVNKY